MCDLHDHHGLPPLAADEFVLDTPFVRELVARVREQIGRAASASDACEAIRPIFAQALARRDWLPSTFRRDVPDSGMGGGIGQWLLFRSADRSLCLFSLVVPPGSRPRSTITSPGVSSACTDGNQDEEFYRPLDGTIELVRRRPLEPGDYYVLLPPPTTFTVSGRPPPRPRSRSTCSRTTRVAPSATRSTRHRGAEPVSIRVRERRLRGAGSHVTGRGGGGPGLARQRAIRVVHGRSTTRVGRQLRQPGCVSVGERAGSSFHLQLLPSAVPGRFILASLPSQSRS